MDYAAMYARQRGMIFNYQCPECGANHQSVTALSICSASHRRQPQPVFGVPSEIRSPTTARTVEIIDLTKSDDKKSIGKENQPKKTKTKEENGGGKICSICLDQPANAVFIPCGHYSFCQKCAKTVFDEQKKCPICRGAAEKVQILYG